MSAGDQFLFDVAQRAILTGLMSRTRSLPPARSEGLPGQPGGGPRMYDRGRGGSRQRKIYSGSSASLPM